MGSLLSFHVKKTDLQEPEFGNGSYTVTVDRRFLNGEFTRRFSTSEFKIGGESWALSVIRLGDEQIIVELENRNSHQKNVCCVLSVVGSNDEWSCLSTVSCTKSFPEYPLVLQLVQTPRSITDPTLKLITERGCFGLKLRLRVRQEDNGGAQGNEFWIEQPVDERFDGSDMQLKVFKWGFKDLGPFDRCTFDSETFDVQGRALRLKFCPRGLTGKDTTASLYLFSESGKKLEGQFWCGIQRGDSEDVHRTYGDFSVSLWETAGLENLLNRQDWIDEESGFLHEGWLRLWIGIQVARDNSPKEKNDRFGTDFLQTETICLLCEDEPKRPSVATLVHPDRSCKVVCLEHAQELRGRRNALCPKCHRPFNRIDQNESA